MNLKQILQSGNSMATFVSHLANPESEDARNLFARWLQREKSKPPRSVAGDIAAMENREQSGMATPMEREHIAADEHPIWGNVTTTALTSPLPPRRRVPAGFSPRRFADPSGMSIRSQEIQDEMTRWAMGWGKPECKEPSLPPHKVYSGITASPEIPEEYPFWHVQSEEDRVEDVPEVFHDALGRKVEGVRRTREVIKGRKFGDSLLLGTHKSQRIFQCQSEVSGLFCGNFHSVSSNRFESIARPVMLYGRALLRVDGAVIKSLFSAVPPGRFNDLLRVALALETEDVRLAVASRVISTAYHFEFAECFS